MIHCIRGESSRYIDDVISKVLQMVINIKFIEVRLIVVHVIERLPGNFDLCLAPGFHACKVRFKCACNEERIFSLASSLPSTNRAILKWSYYVPEVPPIQRNTIALMMTKPVTSFSRFDAFLLASDTLILGTITLICPCITLVSRPISLRNILLVFSIL